MIRYPIIVQDDFFEDPDSVVELANSVDYFDNDGRWPGKRSDHLMNINESFHAYFVNKVFSAFGLAPSGCEMSATFQKINPFSENKWDAKNRGWIHVDSKDTIFGGIVYLNKNADKDTGTSIYKAKKGCFPLHTPSIKKELYKGEDVNDDDYTQQYNEYTDQFEETVKVDNIYNRFLSFPSNALHGVRTCGTEERLTIPFFCHSVSNANKNKPLPN